MSCLANVPLSSARSRRLRRARLCLRDGSAYTSFLRIRTLGSSRQSKLWGRQQQTHSGFNCGERHRRASRLPVSSLRLRVGQKRKRLWLGTYTFWFWLSFWLTAGALANHHLNLIKCGIIFSDVEEVLQHDTPLHQWTLEQHFKALSFHVLCYFAFISFWNYLFCFANTKLNPTLEAFPCGRMSCYNWLKLTERRMKKGDTRSVECCIPRYYILNYYKSIF